MNNYYFSHARTALKYILLNIVKEKQSILLPNYICDSVLHPIHQLKISYSYYKINYQLKIDWDNLIEQIDHNTKVILFVNYFGIPNEIIRLKELCHKKKIILVEDNSHGFMGFYNNELMGTLADYGIASPRKHINVNYGGILYSNKEFIIDLPKIKNSNKENFLFNFKKKLNNFPKIKLSIKKIIKNRPLYEDQNSFREKYIKDYLLDDDSLKIINNNDHNKMRKKNFTKFLELEKFCFDNKLKPIFNNYHQNINPWCFPVLLSSQEEQIKWFNWAWKNNIEVFSWPTLPLELIGDDYSCYKMWKRILCFSIK